MASRIASASGCSRTDSQGCPKRKTSIARTASAHATAIIIGHIGAARVQMIMTKGARNIVACSRRKPQKLDSRRKAGKKFFWKPPDPGQRTVHTHVDDALPVEAQPASAPLTPQMSQALVLEYFIAHSSAPAHGLIAGALHNAP